MDRRLETGTTLKEYAMDANCAPESGPLGFAPTENHQWLEQFIGDWTSEMEAKMDPDQPPFKSTGTESARALGPLWIVADGVGHMPDGEEGLMILTLGYEPGRGKFVGSWVGSMMTYLWTYEGELDAGRRILTLNCQGPAMEDNGQSGKLGNYRDIHEIIDADHRTLRSQYQGPDGTWREFMVAHYYRKQ
jgi:hypothetical protein